MNHEVEMLTFKVVPSGLSQRLADSTFLADVPVREDPPESLVDDQDEPT